MTAGAATNGILKTSGGFAETAKWQATYKQASADLDLSASSGTKTINNTSGSAPVWAAASPSGGNVSTVPSLVIVIGSSTEFTSITGTFTYTVATDSSLFQTNGPIWSGQMRSFDQATALMIFGLRWNVSASA